MSLDTIKPYLEHSEWCIYYQGQVLYDFKSELNNKRQEGNTLMYFKKRKYNYVNIGKTNKTLVYVSKGLHESTTPPDFYYYFLIDRVRVGISPDYLPSIAKFFYERISKQVTFSLTKIVENLLKYGNVITDIPGIGGTDISSIYKTNPELWDGAYPTIKESLAPALISNNIDLSNIHGNTTILLNHHPELAYHLTENIPNSIPITLLSKGIYYK